MAVPLQINQSFNFSTLAPSLLGAIYTNMKVTGILTYTEAIKRSDVLTKHAAVSQIITGLPTIPNNLIFIVFTDTSGAELVIAEAYIDPVTIVAITSINITIEIQAVDSAMEAILRLRLQELGITSFTLTLH